MLRYSFGLEEAAANMENAVKAAIGAGVRTGDVAQGGPAVGTREMGEAIAEHLS
jgi:3-isopropylmalate dehydrogenase